MGEVQLAEAKANLTQLIDSVESGETIVITRDGKAVARIIPEMEQGAVKTRTAMQEIAAFRQTMPSIGLADLQSARRVGQKG
ncbi:type II toxin-antitoxin system Phd/YefM family antitoxin [Segnochrobactrum spirostomi]|uniref:type II toxin-antitoxin system Phd/YefM family antitoxin n=1 Tax=Segnochrobactrum spirostomi TaxID=2608987 RepID=UPI001AD8085A|nr:type II toxin-antitoxin system prevent-host-death family antitoxin [Segnochrobactrum spirostomi]